VSHDGPDPLDSELKRAGAVLVSDHGSIVPANFGSVSGEIAVCQRGVGMADRTDLTVLELSGKAERVAQSVERMTSRSPEAGASWVSTGSWWVAISAERVLALADWTGAERIKHGLRAPAPGLRTAELEDVTDSYSVLTLIGPRTGKLLAAAGLTEADRPSLDRFTQPQLAGKTILMLRESDSQLLLLARADSAVVTWTHLRDAGIPLGIGFVGLEALARLGVAARTRARQAAG